METKVFNLGDYRRIRYSTHPFWELFHSIQPCRTYFQDHTRIRYLFIGPPKGPRKAEKGWTVITSSLTTAILKGWEFEKRWKLWKCGIIEPCQVCKEALEDVFAWLAEGGEVAVFDATNTTRLALLICGLLPQGLGRPGYLKNYLCHRETKHP